MSDNSELQRALGRIEGQMQSLVNSMSVMSERSDNSRSKIYEKIEKFDSKMTDAINYIDGLDIRISKVEPVIADVSKWRERAIGARMAITLFVASLGGSIALAIQWVWAHFGGKTH